MGYVRDTRFNELLFKNRNKTIPKINLQIDDNNRIILELLSMSVEEQNTIICDIIEPIYGNDYRKESIVEGVRIYAPTRM